MKLSSLISNSWGITGFSFLHCFLGPHSRASRLSWLAARSQHVRPFEHNQIIHNLPFWWLRRWRARILTSGRRERATGFTIYKHYPQQGWTLICKHAISAYDIITTPINMPDYCKLYCFCCFIAVNYIVYQMRVRCILPRYKYCHLFCTPMKTT